MIMYRIMSIGIDRPSVNISWDDGKRTTIDMTSVIARGGIFRQLQDPDVFATARIGDRGRSEYEQAILEDLGWLGLEWEQPVRRQSEHGADYRAALGRLAGRGVLYPCFCTRAAIAAEIAAAGAAPHGADGPLYPGLCRRLDPAQRAARLAAGEPHALRLDAAAAA